MRQCLGSLYPLPEPQDKFTSALEEAEQAAAKVLSGENEVELSPQTSYIRRLQHEIAERHHLFSSSSGRDPLRRVHFRRNG
jgi:predicted RNA-binding protein Jag